MPNLAIEESSYMEEDNLWVGLRQVMLRGICSSLLDSNSFLWLKLSNPVTFFGPLFVKGLGSLFIIHKEQTDTKINLTVEVHLQALHDGAEVSASGWRSGGPRLKSRPRLISQSWSSYQLNQLGSKAASDSTLKQLTLAGYQILVLYFYIYVFNMWNHIQHHAMLHISFKSNACISAHDLLIGPFASDSSSPDNLGGPIFYTQKKREIYFYFFPNF